MTDETRRIRYYQDKDPELALTFAQAKFLHEQEAEDGGEYARFSVWEQLDYEYEMYRRVLTESQFELFEAGWARKREQVIERIKKSDEEQAAAAFDYYQPIYDYLRDHFWNEVRALPLHESYLLAGWKDEAKWYFLRSEYRIWESRRRSEQVTEHFRQYSRFSPLCLQATERKIEVERLLPPHSVFYAQADEATKGIYHHLKKQCEARAGGGHQELRAIISRYEDFLTENRGQRQIPGWHVAPAPDTRSEAEKWADWIMCLFLAEVK